MRILAFTDLHGSFDVVEGVLEGEKEYDLIIIGGDLTTIGTPRQAEEGLRRLQHFERPVVAVAGNMDPVPIDATLTRLGVSINGCGIVEGGVGFFGVSGAPHSPLHTPYEIAEEEIAKRAEAGWADVAGAKQTVFVPHAPPWGTALDVVRFGTHVGSVAVLRFIELHQPSAVVCGHIHEARGIDRLGSSVLVNCGAAGRGFYAFLEVGEQVRVELREAGMRK